MKHDPLSPLAQVLAAGERIQTRVRVGVLVDATDGRPRVDFPGNSGGPVLARSMIAVDLNALHEAARRRRGVVLLFEEDDLARPIIAGFIETPSATPVLDAVLEATIRASDAADAPKSAQAPAVAEVDGHRVQIEGKDEVVLRCGEASITLLRNGKVIIRGLYVETHAAGTNRVKGGTVKIN